MQCVLVWQWWMLVPIATQIGTTRMMDVLIWRAVGPGSPPAGGSPFKCPAAIAMSIHCHDYCWWVNKLLLYLNCVKHLIMLWVWSFNALAKLCNSVFYAIFCFTMKEKICLVKWNVTEMGIGIIVMCWRPGFPATILSDCLPTCRMKNPVHTQQLLSVMWSMLTCPCYFRYLLKIL